MADNNNNNDNASSNSGSSTPRAALPRVTRNASGDLSAVSAGSGNVGPGMMAPPSTRMQMPGRGGGGPRGLGVRRSQSFKRTSKAATALSSESDHSHTSAASSAAAGTGTGVGTGTGALSPTRDRGTISSMETATVARPTGTTTLSPNSSFNRGTTTANFVKNFLEEDDNAPQGDGSASGGMTFDAETQRNVHRSLLSPSPADLLSTTPTGSGGSAYAAANNSASASAAAAAAAASKQPQNKGLFKGRDDFYNVDQSVNLMDAEAGKYESKTKSGGRRTSNSMVDIWLKDNPVSSAAKNVANGNGHNGWWHNPQRQAQWNRMTAWEKIKDIAFRMIIPLTLIIIILLVVLFVVIQHGGSSGSAAPAPAPAPTPDTSSPAATDIKETPAPVPISNEDMTSEMQAISNVLADLNVATSADFQNAKSPTFQALSWISQDDIALTAVPNDKLRRRRGRRGRRHLQEADTERLVQRYVLAVLYYTWKPVEKEEGASGALGAAMSSMNLLPPKDGTGASGSVNMGDNELWLSAVSECHWHGIGCHNEAQELATMGVLGTAGATQIRAINLTAHELNGNIPKELNALTNLVELDLRNNKLNGNLNSMDFESWPQLEYLLLGSNHLGGSLPPGLENLQRIKDIDFSDNKFTGPLPDLSGGKMKLNDLENVYWDRNQLTGTIPESMLHDMGNIEYFDVGDNKLEGTLPDALFELPRLRYVHAKNNSFTGGLPEKLSSMSHLETLFVEFNKLEGTVPDLSGMERLANLHLNHNKLTGPLPEGLSNLKHVKLIKLGGNKFTGTIPPTWFDESKKLVALDLGGIGQITGKIPTELGTLGATLHDLRIGGNGLSGTLPSEIGKLSELKTCFLDNNALTGTVPAEWAKMIQMEDVRLYENKFTGSIPKEMCEIEKEFESEKGKQLLIYADCKTGDITCDCCHKCY